MLTEAEVVETSQRLLGEPVCSAEAWCHEQRHQSWLVTTCGGDRRWLKIGTSSSAVAGLDREATVLRHLGGRLRTPVLVGWEPGRHLATAHVHGQSLASAAPDAVAAALPAVARWLGDFADRAGVPPYPDGTVAAWDLFGPSPDIGRLLADARKLWDRLAPRRWPAGDPKARAPEPVSVHGSFDTSNILISGGSVSGVVDLEAGRMGPVAVDVASLAASLVLDGRDDLARLWLDIWTADRPQDVVAIAGFLRLRLWFRHQADATPVGFTESLVELVLWLEECSVEL